MCGFIACSTKTRSRRDGVNEDALPKSPTEGDWRISIPCQAVTSKVIDVFWVTTSVQHGGQSVGQISTTDTKVDHQVTIENCSGFPANVNLFGDLPQQATGITYSANASSWAKLVKNIQPNEKRSLQEQFDLSSARTGVEAVHAGVRDYTDLFAGSNHTPSNPAPLFFSVTIV